MIICFDLIPTRRIVNYHLLLSSEQKASGVFVSWDFRPPSYIHFTQLGVPAPFHRLWYYVSTGKAFLFAHFVDSTFWFIGDYAFVLFVLLRLLCSTCHWFCLFGNLVVTLRSLRRCILLALFAMLVQVVVRIWLTLLLTRWWNVIIIVLTSW